MSTPADDAGEVDYWTVNALVQRGRHWARVTDLAAHNDAKALLIEARAEADRLRAEVEPLQVEVGKWRTLFGSPERGMAFIEKHDNLRATLVAALDLLDGLVCLDRAEDESNWCSAPAVAIPWGTLYRKDQVGPKCSEHLRLRHPDLGALIPGPLSGPAAIVFVSDLRATLAADPVSLADVREPKPTHHNEGTCKLCGGYHLRDEFL